MHDGGPLIRWSIIHTVMGHRGTWEAQALGDVIENSVPVVGCLLFLSNFNKSLLI